MGIAGRDKNEGRSAVHQGTSGSFLSSPAPPQASCLPSSMQVKHRGISQMGQIGSAANAISQPLHLRRLAPNTTALALLSMPFTQFEPSTGFTTQPGLVSWLGQSAPMPNCTGQTGCRSVTLDSGGHGFCLNTWANPLALAGGVGHAPPGLPVRMSISVSLWRLPTFGSYFGLSAPGFSHRDCGPELDAAPPDPSCWKLFMRPLASSPEVFSTPSRPCVSLITNPFPRPGCRAGGSAD